MVVLPLSIADARDCIRASRDRYIFPTIRRKRRALEGGRRAREKKAITAPRKCRALGESRTVPGIVCLISYEILFSRVR